MFEHFRRFDIQTSDPQVKIHGVVGGSGPPVLLLHGNPLTHVHWHLVAPRLARHFTVVATDLRGYGDSSKPRGLPDHSNYSFRRMAQDQVDVMSRLGFETFCVAGHDRGGRAAFRMALDQPDKVLRIATIDIIPTHYVLAHITREWALNSYHWFFMAQPYDIPEKLFEGKEGYYIEKIGESSSGTFSLAITDAGDILQYTVKNKYGVPNQPSETILVTSVWDVDVKYNVKNDSKVYQQKG